MNASDWTLQVDPEGRLRGLYGAGGLPLEACELFYLQIDERERSATLGFETGRLPPNPPPEWGQRPYNTVEFFVAFTNTSEIFLSGWNPSARAGVALAPHGTGSVRVSLEHADSRLRFTATGAAVTRVRPYLAGGE
ncbi:Imm50 family immunity protein [Streptomyces sp. NPDC048018]|uniref:Imm50 family immunity protein n=1 Tax=Streptomyces sp. NPDC048018 TaxID=3365499 RepID=UPI0037176587